MFGTHDQRCRYAFHVDAFDGMRSYHSPTSEASDTESPIGGGGGGSADSAGSGGSQSTAQQNENREDTPQHRQLGSYASPRSNRPQAPASATHEFTLEHELNIALPQQSATPAFSGDNRYRSQGDQFQQFYETGVQSSTSSGDGGQTRRHYRHTGQSTSPSSSTSSSSHNSLNMTPGAYHQSPYPDAGDYLRHQLGLPPGTPVNLNCLPDPPPGQKPPQPYPILIKLAIYGSPNKMLTLQGIYDAIEERFEFFKKDKSGAWKRSIRHNLSLNRVFKNTPRPITEPGKGSYWELDISQGEGYKRERKRRKKGPAGRQQTRSRQGQQDSETDSQSIGEEEEESEISSPSRSESPAQRDSGIVGPHRHASAFIRRSSPYPAGDLTARSRAASTGWAPVDTSSRAEIPAWGPGYAAGQGQVPQAGGYQQVPFPLPTAMTGQDFPQQPVFRSGPFGHTMAWHAQQQMRQQSLARASNDSPQFSYPASMSSVVSGHFQHGSQAVPPPIIAGGVQAGSGQFGNPPVVVPGTAIRAGSSQLGSATVPPLVIPGGGQYHPFGQGQIYGEHNQYQDDDPARGQQPHQGSSGGRQERHR